MAATQSYRRTKLGLAQSHPFFSSGKRANWIQMTFKQLWREAGQKKKKNTVLQAVVGKGAS